MQRISSKTLLTVALLLIGGYALGGIILPKAIGANISFTIKGPASNLSWDPGADWDDHNVSSSIYIMADRIGNNGNIIGTLSVSGSRSPIFNEDDELTDHSYTASASAYGAKGKANALVQVPGKEVAHDEVKGADAAVNWNNPNIPDGMTAWDSCIRWEWGTGLRSMKGSAAHSAEGARVTIGFSASGI